MTPRVFLCEPSGLSAAQRVLSDQWHERLFGLGFDVDQVPRDDYQRNPWSGLRQRIDSADGVLVLGFEQLLITAGTWRRGSTQESELVATWSSSWLQVETGIALAVGLPVLAAPESGVSEGVFAPDTWIGALRGTAAEAPEAHVVEEWAGAVTRRAILSAVAFPMEP